MRASSTVRSDPRPSRREPGLYPGEPEACRRDSRQFLKILAHLGLLWGVFKAYRLENRAFVLLAAIAVAALPIHYLLPYRWKKPLFLATSVLALTWVFGGVMAAYVLGISAVLIGVCYLPIPWAARAASVGAFSVAVILVGPQRLAGVVPESVWPVLATMFMFRMFIYLYELKHAKKPESLLDTLCYFFLLPNYCFLHFPVVDYRTLQRGYFARDIHEIQRAGLRMMVRGTLHLLVYRLVYHKLWGPADDVHNMASLALYLVSNYLLYLHVSGQFHLACGMLHLYGFQLPETHHNFLLATGFTDYWRRINIYWKDFMVRLVFNPAAFRLKRWPQPVALAVATLAVFVATWSLHAYQSYWLRGRWGISAPDALFWGILGGLVLVNVQLDARRPRGRRTKPGTIDPGQFAIRSVKVAGTFLTITLLWSLWSSPTVGAWVGMLRRGFGI